MRIASTWKPVIIGLSFLLAASGSAAAELLISIDKLTQQMTVSVDGVPQHRWLVSTGGEGYGTPTGTYTPFRLEVDHYSREWDDAPMPHSIFFTQEGHAIHGTESTTKLGSPVSHGCVRLAPWNAEQLFAMVKAHGLNNTRVEVIGSEWEMESMPPIEVADPRPDHPFLEFGGWLEYQRRR